MCWIRLEREQYVVWGKEGEVEFGAGEVLLSCQLLQSGGSDELTYGITREVRAGGAS